MATANPQTKKRVAQKLDATLAEIEERIRETLAAGKQSSLSLNPDELAKLAQSSKKKGVVPARTGRMSEKELDAAIQQVNPEAVKKAIELASLLEAGAKSGNWKALDGW